MAEAGGQRVLFFFLLGFHSSCEVSVLLGLRVTERFLILFEEELEEEEEELAEEEEELTDEEREEEEEEEGLEEEDDRTEGLLPVSRICCTRT